MFIICPMKIARTWGQIHHVQRPLRPPRSAPVDFCSTCGAAPLRVCLSRKTTTTVGMGNSDGMSKTTTLGPMRKWRPQTKRFSPGLGALWGHESRSCHQSHSASGGARDLGHGRHGVPETQLGYQTGSVILKALNIPPRGVRNAIGQGNQYFLILNTPMFLRKLRKPHHSDSILGGLPRVELVELDWSGAVCKSTNRATFTAGTPAAMRWLVESKKIRSRGTVLSPVAAMGPHSWSSP